MIFVAVVSDVTHAFHKYVEFAGLDDDLDEPEHLISGTETPLRLPNPNAEKANAHRGKSLEALLATKNKRILEELTKFRVSTFLCQEDMQLTA